MISIVIPAYNEEKYLANCLISLTQQRNAPPFEVIVVDNNSTDNTVSIASSYKKKLHLKILIERKKGRGAARRLGFSHAKGNIILSTDADTMVPPHWIYSLVKHFKTNLSCVAVTAPMKPADLSVFKNKIAHSVLIQYMYFWRVCMGYYPLNGFNFGIRREIYDNTGGFSSSMQGYEDIDLSIRVRTLGHICFLPNIFVSASGRRFKQGLVKGSFEYIRMTWDYFVAQKRNMIQSDIR